MSLVTGDARAAIAQVGASDRLLVALDFDGTLSPLVDDPMSARMHPVARAAVEALVEAPATLVALVSGRSLVDLRVIAEHDDDSPLLLAGSHGAEFWFPGTGFERHDDDPADAVLRDRLRSHAEDVTAHLDGVWIEPKTFGFGVHTRRAEPGDAAEANRLVDALVSVEAPEWRRRSGFNIVEYAFRHEGKDSAVAELREKVDASAVVFAGDDVTDEDAMRTLGPGDLGIRVGDGETAATLRVPDITALAGVLALIAQERSAARG